MDLTPSGNFVHKATLQTVTRTQRTGGGFADSTSNVGTFWVAIMPLSSAEIMEANAKQTVLSHRVMIRHPGVAIKTKDRLLFNGRTFEIISAINKGELSQEWELMTKEME